MYGKGLQQLQGDSLFSNTTHVTIVILDILRLIVAKLEMMHNIL